jgi:hypothetical protein
MHPCSLRKRLLLLGQLGLAAAAFAANPSWKEIEAAAQAGDFARLERWVRESGIQSPTAAEALISAALCGDRTMVDRLLALGISSNATNRNGLSPLLAIARNGQTEMVRHFLQRGAQANTIAFCEEADCQGHTPLMGAVCKQDLQMAKMLLEAGADPRAAADSATQIANANGDVELFLLLKQFGGKEKAAHPAEPSGRRTDAASGATVAEPATSFVPLGLTELLPGKANLGTSAGAKAKARLSVIADDGSVSLADLLTARITAEPLLELVERQELDRILSEQKLTRQFAADAAHYGQVAGLLRADALLLINERKIDGRKLVESRFIRVNPGLVLDTVYSATPVANPAEWAERMGARVVGLAAKAIRQDAIALSLLNIRASVSSAAGRGLDRTLAVLLCDRLAHQPHFVLLERAAMKRLAAEDAGQFWTGSFLVDGTLEPALDNSGAFSLSIRFQPTGRGETLTFTAAGGRADPAAVVDELLTKINARVAGSQLPARRNLADEAQRYLDEGQWALNTEQPGLAQSAAEAAWALGLRSLDVARLRILATVRTLRDLHSRRDPDLPASPACLDLGIHGVTVWRDTLQSELVQGRPEELRKWLEFGLETTDGVLLALITIDTAAEQVRQAERLEILRDLIWTSLQEMWTRSAELPPDTGIGNAASEKQAAVVRLLFPRTSEFLPAVRGILARKFKKDDARTRARIRSNLIFHLSLARVMVQSSRTSSGSANLRLSPGDEASRRLASELRNSPAPEDRYVAALLAIWTASLRREATPADVDRLRASLFDMDKLLAEGGEVFDLYWERFKALDKLDGVPFFAINQTFSPKRDIMWERNTPEHTEFCRQLFLRLCAVGKGPPSHYQKLLSMDVYTPEQAAEVAAVLGRPVTPTPGRPAIPRPGSLPPSNPTRPPEQTASQSAGSGAPTLSVWRLWTPFELGLEIPPEFEAAMGTMTWAEGRIWLHACTLNPGGQPDRHFIFAIEPDSLRTETLAVPGRSPGLAGRIIITPTLLLFVHSDLLMVRDRATGCWDTYKEIKTANLGPPVLVGNSLHLIVTESPGNALICFDLKQRTTEVLASTRRRPAASPLDDPGLEIKSIANTEAGEVAVVAETVGRPVPQIECISHAWSPTQRTWRQVHPQTLKSALPRPPQPARAEFARVGRVRPAGGQIVLRFVQKDAPVPDIPLTFVRRAGLRLPDSRYGPQNVRPDYCSAFPSGVVLVPSSGSGFWVIPQKEIDDYRLQNTVAAKSAASASN